MSDGTTTRPRPPAGPAPESSAEFISVVIPVRNEEKFLGATLRALLAQDYPADRFELIVADGESTDSTRDVVRELQRDHPNVLLVDNPGRLASAGRNAGVRAARGSLILIVDGHCEIEDGRLLGNVADAFRRSGADCLGRPQPQDVTAASGWQRAIAAARASWLGHHSASFIYSSEERFVPPQSVAVAYRRSVFDRVGMFDERFDACEDYEFNVRVAAAGMRCFFTPRIRVRYVPRATLRGLFRQLVRYGRGRVRLLRKHPRTFSPASFVPAALVAFVAAGLPLACLWRPAAVAYFGVLALYGLLVSAAAAGAALRARSLDLAARLPLVFLTIHAAAGAGVIAELITGSGRPERPVRTERPLKPLREGCQRTGAGSLS